MAHKSGHTSLLLGGVTAGSVRGAYGFHARRMFKNLTVMSFYLQCEHQPELLHTNKLANTADTAVQVGTVASVVPG